MSFKAKTHKLLNSGDGTGGATNWAYVAEQHPIEKCLEENFFSTCVGNLLAGDRIFLIEKKENDVVTAACNVMVLEVCKKPGNYLVRVAPYEENGIRRFDGRPETIKPPEPKEPDVKYVEGNGQVEWNIGQKEYMVKVDGKVVHKTSDKKQANAIARGDIPLPPPDIFDK